MIDPKKNRLRVHSTTLEMMGKPKFVWFLVNPDTPSIAVCPALSAAGGAVKASYSKSYTDFYSLALVNRLSDYLDHFDKKSSYLVTGKLSLENTVSVFNLQNSVQLTPDEEVALVG